LKKAIEAVNWFEDVLIWRFENEVKQFENVPIWKFEDEMK
jgi:hypothetical protein